MSEQCEQTDEQVAQYSKRLLLNHSNHRALSVRAASDAAAAETHVGRRRTDGEIAETVQRRNAWKCGGMMGRENTMKMD